MEENNMPQAEYEPDILTLEDEDGVEHTFEVLDEAEVKGQRYLALVPYYEDAAESLEQEAELLIMRASEEDGEEVLDLLEEEDELHEIGQFFLERLKDVFDVAMDEETPGEE